MLRVDQASFQTEVVDGSFDQPVFIAFAPTTGPTTARLEPILAALEAEHPGALKVVRVDPAEQPEIAAACGVGDAPEVIVVTAGTGVAKLVSPGSEGQLREFVGRFVAPTAERWAHVSAALAARGDAATAARTWAAALAIDPANDESRRQYAAALIDSGESDHARQVLEPLQARAEATGRPVDDMVATLLARLEALEQAASVSAADVIARAAGREPAAGGATTAHRFAAAQGLVAAGRWHEAGDALLAIVGSDRAFGDDLARRTLVSLLDRIDDRRLVGDLRTRLSALLFR